MAKLHEFLNKNPHLNLDYYLRNLEDSFRKNIKFQLERYRTSLSDSGSTPNARAMDVQPQDNPTPTSGLAKSKSTFGISGLGS